MGASLALPLIYSRIKKRQGSLLPLETPSNPPIFNLLISVGVRAWNLTSYFKASFLASSANLLGVNAFPGRLIQFRAMAQAQEVASPHSLPFSSRTRLLESALKIVKFLNSIFFSRSAV